MIKLIIFDLDGVLVEAKKIHFDTLNTALSEVHPDYAISWEEHLSIYDGLKTSQKLQMLHTNKGLPERTFSQIWNKKQELTIQLLKGLPENKQLQVLFERLANEGYKIACCSNSVRKTILTVLSRFGIIEYFDYIVSNEDVSNSKPHPEIYWKAMMGIDVLPEETLILEDSPYGLLAANRSNSHVLRIKTPEDVTYGNIKNRLLEIKKTTHMKPKWTDKKLNVLIPMAGAGSRFEQAGYTFPKPLIEVENKPMIQVVVENLNMDANYIFIVQKSHREKYNLDVLLNLIAPNCKIVEVEGVTEGAACTTLLAKKYINNDQPLVIANSDQFVDWDSNEFMYKMNETNADGGILTFTSTHPKWSFSKLDEYGYVTEVAEKRPISDIATVGIYYWKKGGDYVKYAESMISKNIRVNNEFYVCPVFNEAIQGGKKIRTHRIEKMWGLGTPEDLDFFLKNKIQWT
jgi:HAD superfamily hydrolase (TIGR01509 family)